MKVVPHFGGRFRDRPVEIRRSGGAPGGAAPVQRASQPRWIGRRASRAGVATPFVRRGPGASQAPARGLASPWRLPALHSLFGTEKGNGRPRARSSAGAAERWLHSLLIVACLFV